MKFTLQQLAGLLNGRVEGDDTKIVDKLGKIDETTLDQEGAVCFLANPKYEPFIYQTKATAVIVSETFVPKQPIFSNIIWVKDAYSAFTILLEQYEAVTKAQYFDKKKGVENPSFIATTSQLGENVYVGAFAYIGENTKIGKNVKIYPQSYIGENVEIGENSIIYAGVKIYQDCKIGQNCTLHAGVVIGAEGFGFAPQPDGSYKNIPQLGNVILEDNVNIGANTTIDRATIGATIIGKGTKIDNLVQIGHNVEIGKNTVIASQVGIAGSAKIGDNCMLGGQVGISGHISIANGSKFAGQSGLNNNITTPNKSWFGSPVLEYKEFLKSYIIFKQLPELKKRVEDLEKK
jgi:UDP-3-O-[3-hydroxymyristoyl] glucosamine N-acyltransferase